MEPNAEAATAMIIAAWRAGEILSGLEKSKGGYAPNAAATVAGASHYARTLEQARLSETTAAIKEAERMLRSTQNVHEFNVRFERSRGVSILLQKSQRSVRDDVISWRANEDEKATLAIEPGGDGLGKDFIKHFLPKGSAPRNDTLQAAITAYYQEEWRKEGKRLLEQAVDAKIEDQAEFVQWWRDNVTGNRSARTDINADRRLSSLSRESAEELTGISQQQVSRWGRADMNFL